MDEVQALIKRGECKTVEFKQTLRYDADSKGCKKELEQSVIKTIAAFANTEGGHLLIGVADDKQIIGLKDDYKVCGKNKNADSFQLHLGNLINQTLGKEINRFITAHIVDMGDVHVCVVEVKPSTTPVYVNDEIFYIRALASTESLKGKKMMEYIHSKW